MKTAAIVKTLNLIQALFNWLAARSVIRSEIVALLDLAHAEDRDITTEDVQNHLDIVADELDDTEDLINERDN